MVYDQKGKKRVGCRFAAVAAGLLAGAGSAGAQAVVDGSITPDEFGQPVAVNDTPSGFSGPESFQKNELGAAFGLRDDSGDVFLGVTGNLQIANSGFGTNAVLLFIDSRPGGAVAQTDSEGFGTLGSVGNARIADFGSDLDPSAEVESRAPSILDPGFNPDFVIEIFEEGSSLIPPIPPNPEPIITHGEFVFTLTDLTLPNDGDPGVVREVGRVTTDPSDSLSQRSFTTSLAPLGGSALAGDLEAAVDNSNELGVTEFVDADMSGFDDTVEDGGFQAGVGSGEDGDPLSATTGFEFRLSRELLGGDGDVKVMVLITNNAGDFLSNQLLAESGLAGRANLGADSLGNNQEDRDPAVDPLFDARLFEGNQFFTIAAAGAPGLVGDLNGDGFVGAGDLDILLGVWNQNVADNVADLNADGFIGAGDLDILLGNWNAGTPPTGVSSVPEPGALGLLIGLGGLAGLRRTRARSREAAGRTPVLM